MNSTILKEQTKQNFQIQPKEQTKQKNHKRHDKGWPGQALLGEMTCASSGQEQGTSQIAYNMWDRATTLCGYQFVLWDTEARINGLVAADLNTLVYGIWHSVGTHCG